MSHSLRILFIMLCASTCVLGQSASYRLDSLTGNYVIMYDENGINKQITFIPATNVVPRITSTVSKDLFYSYQYLITNDTSSMSHIEEVVVETSDDVCAIMPPDTSWHRIHHVQEGYVKWYCIVPEIHFTGDGYYYNLGIAPGNSLGGFLIASAGIPVIVNSYFQGSGGVSNSDEELPEDVTDIIMHLTDFPFDYRSLKTIAPHRSKTPIACPVMIDSILSYIEQSKSLGWITSSAGRDDYRQRYLTAKTHWNEYDIAALRVLLDQTLAEIESDSGSVLTSEAYALLRYNTEYLLSQLPPIRPENLTGALGPGSNRVSLQWTPEYGGTMLPNGGGYDVYRSVYYNGAAVSYAKANGALVQSGSFAETPPIPANIPAGKQVYLRYYVVSKNTLGIVSAPSDTLSLFVGTTMAGTVSSSAVWSGDRIVTGNLTVNSGVTVSVPPGTTLRFGSGTGISSSGVISAVGTEAQPVSFIALNGTAAGSWGSVVLNGAGAAGSVFRYARFKHSSELAAYNIPSASAGVEVSQCIIDTAVNGIRFNNAKGTAVQNVITMARDHGIIFDNNATGDCRENIITKVNKSGAAVIFSGGATGSAWKNRVAGYNWGLASYWGAMPVFGHTSNQGVNNHVTGCLYGLRIYNWSYPDVGLPAALDSGRTYGNNVFGNTKNAYVSMTPDDTVFAQNVYWGTASPAGTFTISSGVKSFDVRNALPESTWSSIPNPAPPATAQRRARAEDAGGVREGIRMRERGETVKAVGHFRRMIEREPSNVRAYLELLRLYGPATAREIGSVFASGGTEAPPAVKLLRGGVFEREGRMENARSVYQEVLRSHPNSAYSARALLNLFYIALYTDNNFILASALYDEAAKRPKLTTDIELSLAAQALAAFPGRKEGGK